MCGQRSVLLRSSCARILAQMSRCCFVVLIACLAGTAQARVERVDILSRSDVLDGKAFGGIDGYEKLIGKVHFAVKPEAAPNKTQ